MNFSLLTTVYFLKRSNASDLSTIKEKYLIDWSIVFFSIMWYVLYYVCIEKIFNETVLAISKIECTIVVSCVSICVYSQQIFLFFPPFFKFSLVFSRFLFKDGKGKAKLFMWFKNKLLIFSLPRNLIVVFVFLISSIIIVTSTTKGIMNCLIN